MACITKPLIRVAVIGGLAAGTAAIVLGPQRVSALAGEARTFVIERVDRHIDDPVALRAQLRELAAEYPQRIADVRGELATLDDSIARLERERDVAQRVVELAGEDLAHLKDLLDAGDAARAEAPGRAINVRFDNRSVPLDEAYTRATELAGTVRLYRDQLEAADRDLGSLAVQRDRLGELLTELETERAQYLAQARALEGQIEMIARNESLIEMLEDRQKTIDELERFEAASLDQVASKMNRIRAEQEARLGALSDRAEADDYAERARAMLDAETIQRSVFERALQGLDRDEAHAPVEIDGSGEARPANEAARTPIEITPGELAQLGR